jgi:hypothetical protein
METNGRTTTYRSWKRFVSTVVAVAVINGLTLIVIQATSASSPILPSSGTIVVTAYGQLTGAASSSDPISVVLSNAQAASLRSAVAALPKLPITFKWTICMEETTVFSVAVRRPHNGVMSTFFSAEAQLCPAPGILHPNKPPPRGVRYCPLVPLISSFFPKGTVAATRLIFKLCGAMSGSQGLHSLQWKVALLLRRAPDTSHLPRFACVPELTCITMFTKLIFARGGGSYASGRQ